MYTRYFGLTEKPFTIAPNPRYLFMSELHREALAHLLYGIEHDGCFVLLTGNIGTGKTTICRCLLQQLPENANVAFILNPKLSVSDLLRTICEELSVVIEHNGATVKDYIDSLNIFLLNSHAEGRNTTLIVDEAQNLEIEVLEQLRLLTNLETDCQKLLRIILIGQPELRDTLKRPELEQISQRITSRYHLTPLLVKDVSSYIQHRVVVAGGGKGTLFTEKAVRVAEKLTGGTPRLINLLCDHALLGAYVENASEVDHHIMAKAGKEVFDGNEKQKFSRPVVMSVAACLLLVVGIYFYSLFQVQVSISSILPFFSETELVHQEKDVTPAHLKDIDIPEFKEKPTFRAQHSKLKYSPPVYREAAEGEFPSP